MAAWPYCTARWQTIRALQLQRNPLCEYCKELGYIRKAEHVDHIEPVKKRPDLAFTESNLRSLCAPCHNGVKQREERSGQRIGTDVDGQPIDTGHPWHAQGK